jgi:hypothetical protein
MSVKADPVTLNTDVEHRLGVIARKQAAGFSAKEAVSVPNDMSGPLGGAASVCTHRVGLSGSSALSNYVIGNVGRTEVELRLLGSPRAPQDAIRGSDKTFGLVLRPRMPWRAYWRVCARTGRSLSPIGREACAPNPIRLSVDCPVGRGVTRILISAISTQPRFSAALFGLCHLSRAMPISGRPQGASVAPASPPLAVCIRDATQPFFSEALWLLCHRRLSVVLICEMRFWDSPAEVLKTPSGD